MRYALTLALLFTTGCAAVSPGHASYALCRDAITAKLVSPASAKWSGAKNAPALAPSDTFAVVIGYVDSQNAFGAMLRSNFVCNLRRDSAGAWVVADTLALPSTGL